MLRMDSCYGDAVAVVVVAAAAVVCRPRGAVVVEVTSGAAGVAKTADSGTHARDTFTVGPGQRAHLGPALAPKLSPGMRACQIGQTRTERRKSGNPWAMWERKSFLIYMWNSWHN